MRDLFRSKPEEDIQATDTASEVAPHIQDDFDLDETDLKHLHVKDHPENQARSRSPAVKRTCCDQQAHESCKVTCLVQEKLSRRCKSAETDIVVLNDPRPGKKCLVLDIDYTLVSAAFANRIELEMWYYPQGTVSSMTLSPAPRDAIQRHIPRFTLFPAARLCRQCTINTG